MENKKNESITEYHNRKIREELNSGKFKQELEELKEIMLQVKKDKKAIDNSQQKLF